MLEARFRLVSELIPTALPTRQIRNAEGDI